MGVLAFITALEDFNMSVDSVEVKAPISGSPQLGALGPKLTASGL